jgi:serine/threonine protein phosphatase PrpC
MTTHHTPLTPDVGTGDAAAGCPHCGATVTTDGARFCEECGYGLRGEPPTDGTADDAAAHPAEPDGSDGSDGLTGPGTAGGHRRPAPVVHDGPGGSRWVSSTVDPVACPGCGSTGADEDGYCTQCGQRQATGADRAVLELASVAGVTDRGVRKRRNEDAAAIGELPGVTLVVVCDGVSSSSRADSAAHAAVDAAMPALLDAVTAGTPDVEATALAAATAQRAVAAAATAAEANPPSSTYVSAIVRDGTVTVGWIGDSRAYWLPPDLPAATAAADADLLDDGATLTGPARLTVDDSFAGQLAAAGVPVAEANADPQAGALVRWLGADADAGPPRVAAFTPAGPGRLLVCSDGLSRYRPTAAELAASAPAGTPVGTAADLVQLARDHGGVDNITVVVVPYPLTDNGVTT